MILPVLVGVIAGIGTGARWYRTLFLEEANQDYARTARAKGCTGITILFRHIVPTLAHYVGVMQRGKIVEQGSAEQILTNPQHPYTKALLASVPRMD